MTGFCGWFDCGALAPKNGSALDAMTTKLTRFDARPARKESARWGGVGSQGDEVDLFRDSNRLAVVWGNVTFADPALCEIASTEGAACAAAKGYAERRQALLGTIKGSFALAILDSESGSAVIAVDRLGTRPLYYATGVRSLVFASTLDALNGFPQLRREVNRQAIYDYVHFHMVPAPQTIFADQHRLLPGTFVAWHDGALQDGRYWQICFKEEEERPFLELKEHFTSLVRKSVEKCIEKGRTGAFLSGGTDSSTVTGMLREVTGEAPRTYSIGFDVHGFDEMSYARLAARHFGADHHEYYVTPNDVVRAVPRIAAIHDQPFGNASAVPAYYCAKLARDDGVDVLLAGDGGDELFGGNSRYATQYLYSLYGDLPGPLQESIKTAVSLLPSVGIVGKAQRYIATACEPMPQRYDNYNLLEHLGPENVFTRQFLESINRRMPASRVEASYHSARATSLINRMLALDLQYTLADNDLPKVMRSCELASIAARFPLLDDDLVAFSARLPPRLKLRGTQLRYFFKQALSGFLPPEIIRKKKHGFGLPVGPWLQAHQRLREMALESLGSLKKRSIVRTQFIDELTADHVERHSSYYGTMVWVLMMFEHWVKQHNVSV